MTGDRVGFTGHQGLTSSTRTLVVDSIRDSLAGADGVVGICSLAEGSDQLFAQTVLSSGGDLIVVVPCDGYEGTFNDASALELYREMLGAASEVIRLDHGAPSEEAFWDAGKRVVQESTRMIAVWDGKPAGGLGGTADVVEFARQEGRSVEVIWPAGSARS